MATLKLIIFPKKTKESGECNIYVQITKSTKSAWIKTDIFVLPDNFRDTKVLGGKNGDRNAPIKNIRLSEIINAYSRLLLENADKIETLDAMAIKAFLTSGADSSITDFFKFTDLRLSELKKADNTGTYFPLKNTLRLVREYHGRNTLNFSEITPRFLEGFSAWCFKKDHKINSVAVYMRYIRSMFNDAIDEYNVNLKNPVILNYPFRRFKIETQATQNRNLQVETIKSIRDFKAISKREQIACDIFMLQLYLFGINVKDLFYLRNEYVIDNRLQFSRFKTDRFYNIKIEPEVQIIIDKYKGKKYLLWFADNCQLERKGNTIPHSRKTEFQYANENAFNRMLNSSLQSMAGQLKLNLPTPLTTYFARHSFATIMREIGISKDDISMCLGHIDPAQNLKTSGIYIKEDFKRMDIANRQLIDFITKK